MVSMLTIIREGVQLRIMIAIPKTSILRSFVGLIRAAIFDGQDLSASSHESIIAGRFLIISSPCSIKDVPNGLQSRVLG